MTMFTQYLWWFLLGLTTSFLVVQVLARLGDHLQDRLRVAAPDVVAREAPLPPVALVDVRLARLLPPLPEGVGPLAQPLLPRLDRLPEHLDLAAPLGAVGGQELREPLPPLVAECAPGVRSAVPFDTASDPSLMRRMPDCSSPRPSCC